LFAPIYDSSKQVVTNSVHFNPAKLESVQESGGHTAAKIGALVGGVMAIVFCAIIVAVVLLKRR
jgi:hypothetical protein